MAPVETKSKRRAAIIFAVVFAVVVVLVGAKTGIGDPGIPDGDVVVVDDVDDGSITKEQFDASMEQAAAQGGLEEVPAEDDPQYEQLRNQALQGLILGVWVRGEAADRGISVNEDEIADELKRIKEQNFKDEKEFQKFVKQSKFTEEDVNDQVELTLLRNRLESEIVSDPDISDKEIEAYYEANEAQFAQPASRDVRVILNEDKKKAEKAKQQLEQDDSDESWEKVAKQFSEDQASKDRGGLLEGLVQGQGDPQLETEAFAAPEGEIVGPFKTDRGFYVIQVTAINEAATQPLDEVREMIEQQLVSVRQQQIAADFQADFVDKWTPRTYCLPDYTIELCRDYVAPEPEVVEGQPSPPPVQSTRPIAPGTSTIPLDGAPQQGLPQGPVQPPAEEGAAPAGTLPIGPDGQPVAPAPGAAPPATP